MSHLGIAQPKVYPVMAREALRHGYDTALRAWTIFRNAKENGVQWFTKEEAISLLGVYGLSRREYYRLSSQRGSTVFYDIDSRGTLWLRGLSKVCETLNVAPGRPIYCRKVDLTRLRNFRAVCHCSGFIKERTVSRSTIEKETGLTPPTQRLYESLEGARVDANYVAGDAAADELPIPDGAYTWTRTNDQGKLEIVWQVPNTYQSGLPLAAKGMAKHVGRRIRGIRLSYGDEVRRRRQRFLCDHTIKNPRGDVAFKTGESFADGRLWYHCRIGTPVKRSTPPRSAFTVPLPGGVKKNYPEETNRQFVSEFSTEVRETHDFVGRPFLLDDTGTRYLSSSPSLFSCL